MISAGEAFVPGEGSFFPEEYIYSGKRRLAVYRIQEEVMAKENNFINERIGDGQDAETDAGGDGRKKKIPAGEWIAVLLTLLAGAFLCVLAWTKMLPVKYLALIGTVLLVLLLLVAALVWDARKRGRFWAGTVLALCMAALLTVGLTALWHVLSTLNSVTSPGTEEAHISVYVPADDPVESLEEMGAYLFGLYNGGDRHSVDATVEEIGGLLRRQIRVQEYTGLTEMVDALLHREIDAMLLDASYLDILAETEGYEDIASRLREVTVLRVKTEPLSQSTDAWDADGALTIYLSGIDSRTGLLARSRSDVNILVTINPETHQVLLVSTPRDFFVPLSISNGQLDKLTHAGIYGVQVSMDTLGMLYDIDIDFYFKVNFEGFKNIVDSLGGVDVVSEYDFASGGDEGYVYTKGVNHLNGSQALAFARERKAFSSGDRQRGKNQMAVIRAVIEKMQSAEVLTNYAGLLQAVEGSFETSVPYDLIAELVRDQLNGGGTWNVVSYSVDGWGDSQVTYSQGVRAYVMVPYQETVDTAKELMRQVRAGETVTAPK